MKPRLIFNVLFVSGAYYLSNGLYMVRGLFLARLVGPSAFGVWSAMRLTQTVAAMSHLGTRRGLVQLAPRAQGAGEYDEAERLRRTTSGLQLLAAALVTVLIAAGALFAGPWRTEWLTFGAVLFFVQIYLFYHAVARSLQRFTLSGTGDIVLAAVSTILGVMAAWRFGLLGFLVALLLAYLAGLAAMLGAGPSYPPPRLDRPVARRLFNVGFPLMASGGLFTLLWNTDKLLLWFFRSSEDLGVYAVQSSFTTVALLAPSALATVLHPHLLHRVGESGSSSSLRPDLLRGTALLAAWSGPVAAAGHVLLHLPIRWLVPEYQAAIEPGQILMIATYFSMMATVPMVVVIASNGQRKLCLIRAVAIAVAALGGAVGLGGGFVWLAIAMGVALAVDGLWTTREALRRIATSGREQRALWGRIAASFILMVGAVWVAWKLVPDQADGWLGDLAATSLRGAIAIVPGLAWAVWELRRLRPETAPSASEAPTTRTGR